MHRLSVLFVLAFSLLPGLASAYTEVVSFGDSLSDFGNNGIATTGPTTTPPSQIGSVWCQQLAVNLFGLPFANSNSGGTDYAQGGAVTNDMFSQVTAYLTAHPTASATALYTFIGGGNDILDYLEAHPTDSAGLLTTATTAANNIATQITSIVNAGGRTILWLNMFPIDKTPGALLSGDGPLLVPAINQYNTIFNQKVASLRAQFPSVAFVAVDANTMANGIIANPATYGLVNVTSGCEGLSVNADTYLFWDSLHPTSRGHQLIANLVYSLLPAGVTYTGWTVEQGLAGQDALQTAVIAHDRLNNLYKYALGLDPHTNYSPGGMGLPVVQIGNFSGSNYLTLTFTGVATDVTYQVQASSNLATGWTTIQTYQGGVAPGTVTVKDTQPVTTSSQRLMRLLMTIP